MVYLVFPPMAFWFGRPVWSVLLWGCSIRINFLSPFDISDKEKSSPSPGHVITEFWIWIRRYQKWFGSVRNQDAIEAQEVQISAWQSLADVEVSSQVEAVSETTQKESYG